MQFSYLLTGICILLLVLSAIFFNRKMGLKDQYKNVECLITQCEDVYQFIKRLRSISTLKISLSGKIIL